MSSAFKWNLSKNNDNEILIRKHLYITTYESNLRRVSSHTKIMKLVYLSPTSLLFLGKSSSDIGKALINCKRRMGSPYTLTPKDNNPFYDTSFNIKMRLTLFSASLAADAVFFI